MHERAQPVKIARLKRAKDKFLFQCFFFSFFHKPGYLDFKFTLHYIYFLSILGVIVSLCKRLICIFMFIGRFLKLGIYVDSASPISRFSIYNISIYTTRLHIRRKSVGRSWDLRSKDKQNKGACAKTGIEA